MFSSVYSVDTVSGLRMNTLGDGLFHTVTWQAVLIGLGILYHRVAEARRRVLGSRVLWRWILVGWGIFNLIEGWSITRSWAFTTYGWTHTTSGGTSLSWSSAPSWLWWGSHNTAALRFAPA